MDTPDYGDSHSKQSEYIKSIWYVDLVNNFVASLCHGAIPSVKCSTENGQTPGNKYSNTAKRKRTRPPSLLRDNVMIEEELLSIQINNDPNTFLNSRGLGSEQGAMEFNLLERQLISFITDTYCILMILALSKYILFSLSILRANNIICTNRPPQLANPL